MILFVDPLGTEMSFVLATPDRTVVSERHVALAGSEFERFLNELEAFVSSSGWRFSDLTAIVCVNGPGPFTGMRVVTLTLNTLALVHGIPAYATDAFSCFRLSGFSGPYLIRANRGEYAWSESGESFELRPLESIEAGSYFGLADEKDFANGGVSVQFSRNPGEFLRNFPFVAPVGRIEPIYIKKPNITLS